MENETMYLLFLQLLYFKSFIRRFNAKETVIMYLYFKLCFNMLNTASVLHH